MQGESDDTPSPPKWCARVFAGDSCRDRSLQVGIPLRWFEPIRPFRVLLHELVMMRLPAMRAGLDDFRLQIKPYRAIERAALRLATTVPNSPKRGLVA